MSTRNAIGYIDEDGMIYGIYCHFDGYIRFPGNGDKLLKHYTNIDTVKELISLKGICGLKDTPKETRDSPNNLFEDEEIFKTKTMADFARNFFECGCEYVYIFKKGRWLVSQGGKFKSFGTVTPEGRTTYQYDINDDGVAETCQAVLPEDTKDIAAKFGKNVKKDKMYIVRWPDLTIFYKGKVNSFADSIQANDWINLMGFVGIKDKDIIYLDVNDDENLI